MQWLHSFIDPEGQVVHWQEQLADFDFKVVHRPGKQHQNADSLSRIPAPDAWNPEVAVAAVTRHTATQNWAATQARDPDTAVIYDRQLRGNRKPKAQEMQSQSREAQSLWAVWSDPSMQGVFLYFQFDAQLPKT